MIIRALSLVGVFAALCGLRLAAAEIPATTPEGFAVPQPGHQFEFPRDHGSHPEFKLEWWYVTGHAYAADQRRFGFQATFFRHASPDKSAQLHMAHMALLDVKTGRFLHQERLNREGWDASASTEALDVRNGPWSLHTVPALPGAATSAAGPTLELRGGVQADVAFRFTLAPAKPLVRFGDEGYSRKGAEPTAASYYLTFPRLQLAGELLLGTDAPLSVTGEAWMDHEISSSQLGGEQVGWDWLSVQFTGEPARELMLYRLRQRNGREDPASTLQWVDAHGKPDRQPFSWEVLSTWKSPATGAEYPARIRVTTSDPATGNKAVFTVQPLAANQELTGKLGGIAYWEGACRVLDADGREVGSAYMELTGYARDLKL